MLLTSRLAAVLGQRRQLRSQPLIQKEVQVIMGRTAGRANVQEEVHILQQFLFASCDARGARQTIQEPVYAPQSSGARRRDSPAGRTTTRGGPWRNSGGDWKIDLPGTAVPLRWFLTSPAERQKASSFTSQHAGACATPRRRCHPSRARRDRLEAGRRARREPAPRSPAIRVASGARDPVSHVPLR